METWQIGMLRDRRRAAGALLQAPQRSRLSEGTDVGAARAPRLRSIVAVMAAVWPRRLRVARPTLAEPLRHAGTPAMDLGGPTAGVVAPQSKAERPRSSGTLDRQRCASRDRRARCRHRVSKRARPRCASAARAAAAPTTAHYLRGGRSLPPAGVFDTAYDYLERRPALRTARRRRCTTRWRGCGATGAPSAACRRRPSGRVSARPQSAEARNTLGTVLFGWASAPRPRRVRARRASSIRGGLVRLAQPLRPAP